MSGKVNKTKIAIKFGEVVREERKRQGISQEKLAELAGIHRTYMGAVERGERNVCIKNIGRIAQALGVSVNKLTRDL